MASKTGHGLTPTTIDTRARRGLVGLRERGKAPTKPREVFAATHDGSSHIVKKQTGSACVNGIDKWWVETACDVKLVVTEAAPKPLFPTCLLCLMEG